MRFSISAILLVFGLSGVASDAFAQNNSEQWLKDRKQFVLLFARPGTNREGFVRGVANIFDMLDVDKDGEVSATDAELMKTLERNSWRSKEVSQYILVDMNGDGAVTQEELRLLAKLKQFPDPEKRVLKLMAADANGDGKLTIAEAEEHVRSRMKTDSDAPTGARWDQMLQNVMGFAPPDRTSVTQKEAEESATVFFAAIDANGDNRLSDEEIRNYRAREPR